MAHGKAALAANVASLDLGDRFTVANPPFWLPPETIEQLVLGYKESISQYAWTIDFNATPAGPYEAWVMESTEGNRGRLPTGGSSLVNTISAGATAALFKSDNVRWIDSAGYAGMFPFDIMMLGERATVSAITNNPITFVAAGAAAHADTTPVTPGMPAGVQAGDLLLVLASHRNQLLGELSISDAGYVLLENVGTHFYLYGKIHTGSEVAPTISVSGNADANSAQMCAFRNAQIDTAITAVQLNSSAQNISFPALDPQQENTVVLRCGWKQDDWTSVAASSGYTKIGDPFTTLGNDQGLFWEYQIQTTRTRSAAFSAVVTGGASAISQSMSIAVKGNIQTATLVRSVNGVSKAQPADTDVQLFRPPAIAR